MKLQKLLSLTRKAINDYQLINKNDKIAIGISGGKDSLVLLHIMANLRRFYPIPFDICAITVNLGYENFNSYKIAKLCNELDVPYYVVETQISQIVGENSSKKHCSLCAKLRKGALNQKALALGCNKIAYAHHMDDLIETAFLSLLYEGRFHSCSPKTYWSTSHLTLIRPMIYIKESEIIGFSNKNPLPIIENPCPYEKTTKRKLIREHIKSLNQDIPGCKERIFRAILDGKFDDWPTID